MASNLLTLTFLFVLRLHCQVVVVPSLLVILFLLLLLSLLLLSLYISKALAIFFPPSVLFKRKFSSSIPSECSSLEPSAFSNRNINSFFIGLFSLNFLIIGEYYLAVISKNMVTKLGSYATMLLLPTLIELLLASITRASLSSTLIEDSLLYNAS